MLSAAELGGEIPLRAKAMTAANAEVHFGVMIFLRLISSSFFMSEILRSLILLSRQWHFYLEKREP